MGALQRGPWVPPHHQRPMLVVVSNPPSISTGSVILATMSLPSPHPHPANSWGLGNLCLKGYTSLDLIPLVLLSSLGYSCMTFCTKCGCLSEDLKTFAREKLLAVRSIEPCLALQCLETCAGLPCGIFLKNGIVSLYCIVLADVLVRGF